MSCSAFLALALVPQLQAAATQQRTFELPHLDRQVTDVRTVGADGVVQRTAIDEAGTQHPGAWLDALRAAEHEAAASSRGNLAASLAAHLDELAEGALTDVAVWLRDPLASVSFERRLREVTAGLPASQIPDAIQSARVDNLGQKAAAYAPLTSAFAADAAAAGAEPFFESRSTPVVFLRADATTIRALALDPRVDEVYRSMPEWEHEGNNAQGTLRTPTAKFQGLTAVASPVRVMVNDTAHVDGSNQYLPAVVLLNGGGAGTHATSVAGNIANNHPTYFAAASGLPSLLSASGTGDVTAPQLWEQAIPMGIDFGNCSWWNFQKGAIEFLDRWFDATIRDMGVMLFKSNGNQGGGSTPYATTPGNGYNSICTGAYSDNDNDDWSDDAMASSSSYWNPVEGHEKPEVASPGTCVATTTTGSSGITSCFGGTSSASPLTTGVATLLASGQPQLLAEMTTVKAMLMVSAWHNVDGAALLSDKDGAGGVHAAAAWAAVRDGQWWHDVVDASDFTADMLDVPMELEQGDETRVIALWFSNPDSALSTDLLEMDLDLTVVGPGGIVFAASASAVNPFELTSFVPPYSGTYTVRLTKQRFDGQTEPLTVAWSSRSDTATAHLAVTDGSPAIAQGVATSIEVVEPYDGGLGAYAVWASAGPGATGGLPGGFALPAPIDALAVALLQTPGWVGTLNGAGASSPIPVAVPIDAALSGVTLEFGALVFDGFAPDLNQVLAVSTPLSATL
ncbi:S8/S53 family peptidase [Engelhardtia mirabilis]|uniref:Serine protease AprX n=1 Tax=Engelhardtia mirabilis TaxID=2528011 RepID=A0A518BHF5_9BACT|nr:Serine protease AprX [Planctomycetes bacterium Pla133]QDV00710.1 Serine protease AprX [Planctomycetes bacterium Pla86]